MLSHMAISRGGAGGVLVRAQCAGDIEQLLAVLSLQPLEVTRKTLQRLPGPATLDHRELRHVRYRRRPEPLKIAQD